MSKLRNCVALALLMIVFKPSYGDDAIPDSDEIDQHALREEERLIEYELQLKESKIESKQFPKKCHVCRLFVQELISFLKENGMMEDEDNDDSTNNGNIIYRAMNEVCANMKDYKVTRIRPFRYIRGSTLLREMFTAAQKDSRVKNWMYSVPESEIDDPTGEIRILEKKCNEFVEKEEDRIVKWFFQKKKKDLVEWLCRRKTSKGTNENACLEESSQINPEIMKKMIKKINARKQTK